MSPHRVTVRLPEHAASDESNHRLNASDDTFLTPTPTESASLFQGQVEPEKNLS